MKKFLLSIAAVACAASMSAASYTLYDANNRGTWTGDGNGYTMTVNAGGKSFTLSTAKGGYTNDLVSPTEYVSWRFYKNSNMTITSADIDMKQVVITFDDYEYNGTTYYAALELSSGWTGSLSGLEFTAVSAGLKTVTFTPAEKQVRIVSIVVSDEEGTIEPPVGPELPEGVIYQNSFEENMDGWVKINDESLSDFNGWKINTNNPKCAICNSYYSGSNHAANAKMQYEFDLKEYKNVALSFEQAFGYDFPTAQNDNYRVYVINGDNTDYLTMANFPAAPESGNWTKEWASNEFDLSEYDGETITIGFEYATDGSKSRAWELKNFILKGDKDTAVEGIAADENVAPVYYNLQGVRVANPESGLYIVVKGSKVSKVVF